MSRNKHFYRGSHQPDATGAGLHEAEMAFPGIHDNPRWYDTGEHDSQSHSAIRAARGNPEAAVTIFRSVPHGVKEINPGDWVTTSRDYAAQHGMHPDDPSQDWPVLSKKVKASQLRTEGNSIHEWGYFP